MDIILRTKWGARYARGFAAAPLPAKELWLHHSVTKSAGPNASFDADAATIRAIESIGQSRFGGGISYTFLITASGRVFEGHGVDRRGAHTGGRNTIARAICLVGDFDTNTVPPRMALAIAELVRFGASRGWWPLGINGGHRDAPGASTACPGRFAHRLIPELNGIIRQTTPPVITGKDNHMIDNIQISPNSPGFRYIIPVGPTSGIVSRAWVSAVVNGPSGGSVRFWAQDDDSGVDDAGFEIGYADGRSGRVWWELPPGTTQVNVQTNFPDGGVIAFETAGK